MRERLITERKNRKWSQEVVAKKLGISNVYVRKIEKGIANPGRETMIRFSNLYGQKSEILFPDLFFIHNDTKCI